MNMDWTGRTVAITGASRGIGRVLALHFGKQGARVAGLARNEAGLVETATRVAQAGGEFAAIPLDLAHAASVQKASEELRAWSAELNVLIHNAADVMSKPFADTSPEEIARQVATNVTGPLQLTRLLLDSLADAQGAIVTVSSLAGYKPNPAQTVYSITKGAVNSMAEALLVDLAPRGIHVLNVALGSVAIDAPPTAGQVAATEVATRIRRAIERRKPELFMSPVPKWLMRAYRFYPPLARLR